MIANKERIRAVKWYFNYALRRIAMLCGIGIPRLAILTNVGQIDSIDEFKALFGDLRKNRYTECAYLTYQAVMNCNEREQQILFSLYFVDRRPCDSAVWNMMGISQRTYYTQKRRALLSFADSFELTSGLNLCQQYELSGAK